MILAHLSVSQLTAFDHSNYGACNSRWYFRHVMGLKEPESKAMREGGESHTRLEHYAETGENVLGPVEAPGLPHLPAPKTAFAEWGFNDKKRVGHWYDPNESLLWLEQVPFVGFMDLWTLEPRAEVIDHKTTSSISNNAKSGDALATPQMIGCGEWLRVKFPDLETVRLSHIYYQTKKPHRAEKFFVDLPTTRIAADWQALAPTVRAMKEVAALASVKEVPRNYESCNAWHKPCPHVDKCPRVFPPLSLVLNPHPKEGSNMSLLSKLVAQGNIPSATPTFGGAAAVTVPAAVAVAKAIAPPAPPPPPAPAATPAAPAVALPPGARVVTSKRIALAVGDTVDDGGTVIADLTGGAYLVSAPVEKAAVATPAAIAAVVETAAEVVKNKGGRPPKVKPSPAAVTTFAPPAPSAVLAVSLASYLASTIEEICVAFNVQDIRLGDKDSPLGFGRWRGVLAAAILDKKPAPGVYPISSAGELNAVAIEALRPVAKAAGITLLIDCVEIEPGVICAVR